MGEDKLNALIQESLATAVRLEAAKQADFKAVIIDTTVQEKAIAFPTDAKLMSMPWAIPCASFSRPGRPVTSPTPKL